MEYLPDMTLLHVFRYLPLFDLVMGARRVCRRWRDVSHDQKLCRWIRIPSHYTDQRALALLQQVTDTSHWIVSRSTRALSAGMPTLDVSSLLFPSNQCASQTTAAHRIQIQHAATTLWVGALSQSGK